MTRGAARSLRRLGLALLVSIGFLPLLPLLSHYCPAAAPVERVFDVWFRLHCQRDPARTLSLLAVPMAVCARCSGIYFGLGAGALLRRPHLTPSALRLWVLGAALLMVADVLLEAQGLHGACAPLRVLSGVLLAYPVGVGLGVAVTRAPDPAPAQSP